jgi:hypothetical protein
MTLCGKVVDLVRLNVLYDARQATGIGQVTVVQKELAIRRMWILVEMVNAIGLEQRRPPPDTVDDVSLFQKKLGQIRAILAGNAGDQGNSLHSMLRHDGDPRETWRQ